MIIGERAEGFLPGAFVVLALQRLEELGDPPRDAGAARRAAGRSSV